jgi:hypothetical protein
MLLDELLFFFSQLPSRQFGILVKLQRHLPQLFSKMATSSHQIGTPASTLMLRRIKVRALLPQPLQAVGPLGATGKSY